LSTKQFYYARVEAIKDVYVSHDEHETHDGDYKIIEILKIDQCIQYIYNPIKKNYIKEEWSCFQYSGPIGDKKYENYPEKMYSYDENDKNFNFENIQIRLTVEKCDPKNQIECPSESEYESNFNKSNKLLFKYMLTDNNMNPKNFTNPNRQYTMELPDIKYIKGETYELHNTFSVSEVISDDGFISEIENKQYFLEHHKTQEMKSFNKIDENKFTMYLSLSNKYNIYNRTYLKLEALLAEIGGFMSTLEYCVLFFFSYYKENNYTVAMVQKMFNLKIKNELVDINGEKQTSEQDNIELNILDNPCKNGRQNQQSKQDKENESVDSSKIDSISMANDNVLDTPLQSGNISQTLY